MKTTKKTCQLNLYPIINHGGYRSQFLVCLFETHTFANLVSTSTPFVQLFHLFQDGLMKSYDDWMMFSHKLFRTSHGILYLGQWIFQLEHQINWTPYLEMHR